MSEFSTIFLDLDDTLIPSTIRSILRQNFKIDLFHLMIKTSLRELQSHIIKALKSIQDSIFIKYPDNDVIIALVSNANSQWLHDTLDPKTGLFKELGKYFAEHKIPVLSAAATSHEFLSEKFGEKIANEIMNTTGNNRKNRWMWKYTTFTSTITKYKKLLKKTCNQIICIGDGISEYKAIKHYSQRHRIYNVEFIRMIGSPTIEQLYKQWSYINEHYNQQLMDNLVHSKKCQLEENEKHAFDVIDLTHAIKQDNDKYGTGSYQLTHIAQYFAVWLKSLENDEYREMHIREMLKKMDRSMGSFDKDSVRPKVIKSIGKAMLCANPELREELGKYRKSLLYMLME